MRKIKQWAVKKNWMKNRNLHQLGLWEDSKPRGWETNVRCVEEKPSIQQAGGPVWAVSCKCTASISRQHCSKRPLLERSCTVLIQRVLVENSGKLTKWCVTFARSDIVKMEGEPHVRGRGHGTDIAVQWLGAFQNYTNFCTCNNRFRAKSRF